MSSAVQFYDVNESFWRFHILVLKTLKYLPFYNKSFSTLQVEICGILDNHGKLFYSQQGGLEAPCSLRDISLLF